MTSERASYANRLNSAKSTGPRTITGKAQSKQNARKHGLSVPDLGPQADTEIEHLAGLIAGKHVSNDVILDAARAAAKSQVAVQRVQAFKSVILRSNITNTDSAAEAEQEIVGLLLPDYLNEIERLGRYEARALSQRKFAFRRFFKLVNLQD